MPRYILLLIFGYCSYLGAQSQPLSNQSLHVDVNQGDTVEATFYFKNTSLEMLYISQVAPDCQCTAAQYPEEGLAPGQSDSITLYYFSKNTPPGPFRKTAMVDLATGSYQLVMEGNCSIIRPIIKQGQRPQLYQARYLKINNQ